MIDILSGLLSPRGPINIVIPLAYLFIAWKLANAAVDHETRGFARWAMMSLAIVCFLFGIGRWLYGQGDSPHWIFFLGHAVMIQHGFLTIRTARKARGQVDNLRALVDKLESQLAAEREAAK